MDKEELRRYDVIWSAVLFVFGIWVLSQALGMPMTDTYGGVANAWYVSPALMPLIVSAGIIILSAILFVIALRAGGAKGSLETLKRTLNLTTERNLKFLVIILSLSSYVYIYLPTTDFYLCSAMFLFYLTAIFYFDDYPVFKKISLFYQIGAVFFMLLFLFNLHRKLDEMFYFVDGIVGLFIAGMLIYAFVLVRGNKENVRRYKIALTISLLVPLLLTFSFRFMLLVPLPKEGAVVDLLSDIYFAIKKG